MPSVSFDLLNFRGGPDPRLLQPARPPSSSPLSQKGAGGNQMNLALLAPRSTHALCPGTHFGSRDEPPEAAGTRSAARACGLNAIERQGSCVLLFCIKDPSCY